MIAVTKLILTASIVTAASDVQSCLRIPQAFVFETESWPEFASELKDTKVFIQFTGLQGDQLLYESKMAIDGSIQKGTWTIEPSEGECAFAVKNWATELIVDDGAIPDAKRIWANILNGGVKTFSVEETGMHMNSKLDADRDLKWRSTQGWVNGNLHGIKLSMTNDD